MPSSRPSSARTRKAAAGEVATFLRTSEMRVSTSSEGNLRSMRCSIVVAVRITHAVVAESYGLTIRLTPRARACSATSSSTGSPPVTTSRRTPIWIDRCWMSQRSPTMMMDWRAGMFSWSENLPKERMSIAPMRTNRSSIRVSSTRWSTLAFNARAMSARRVLTWRMRLGSLTLGVKKPPRWNTDTVPTTRRSGASTGRTRMSCPSISSSASAQVASCGMEMTSETIRSHTRGVTSLRYSGRG